MPSSQSPHVLLPFWAIRKCQFSFRSLKTLAWDGKLVRMKGIISAATGDLHILRSSSPTCISLFLLIHLCKMRFLPASNAKTFSRKENLGKIRAQSTSKHSSIILLLSDRSLPSFVSAHTLRTEMLMLLNILRRISWTARGTLSKLSLCVRRRKD